MNDIVWLAVAVLGLLTVLNTFAVIALARQVGILHVRLGPVGARMLNPGPEIGDLTPTMELTDIAGRSVRLGGEQAKNTLLLFLSPGCQNCSELVPALRTWYRTESDNFEIVLVSTEASRDANEAFVAKYRLQSIPFVASLDLVRQYRIGVVPYALVINRSGRVRAKGLVNNMAHLESLLNAEEIGHPSVESAIKARYLSENGSAVRPHNIEMKG